MSQHHYVTTRADGTTVKVFCGWDRMLQTHFLDVMIPADDPKQDDEVIYSSLEDQEAPLYSAYWSEFMVKLSELNISIPDEMAQAVILDKKFQVGNSLTNWN